MKDVVIFFDIFDTLACADRGYLEKYFDIKIDQFGDIGILKNAKMTIELLVSIHPELLFEHTVEEMTKYYEERMNNSLMNIDIRILSMLKTLKDEGYKLCIISDTAYADIENWDKSPLAKYFDKTIFSCEQGYIKPDDRLYETAKKSMESPSKCVYIGDGGHDELYGAKNANMKTIKAEWFINRKEDKIYQNSDYRTQNPEQVIEILKENIFL